MLNFRKILYLPRLFAPEEKRILILLIIIAALSGAGFFSRIYFAATVPVPRIGGTYTEGIIGEPRIINPVLAVSDADRDITRLVFSGLFQYDGRGKIQPDLAERLEISKDAKTYTVVLKQNIQWHDAKPLGADDVAFTVHMVQNPQYKSPLRANWQGVTIEKIDDHTIKFILRSPYAPFIENLTLGILPKHLWENVKPEQAMLSELLIKPIGSGPFMFEELEQNKDGGVVSYTLARNTHYHRPGPYLQTIRFLFFEKGDELLSAWKRGAIEGLSPAQKSSGEDMVRNKTNLFSLRMPRIYGIFLNQSKARALADTRVREAISYAINREDLAARARATGFIPTDLALPWSEGGETAVSKYHYDPDRAATLLDAAGWKDKNLDGVREKGKTSPAPSGRTQTPQPPEKSELRFTLTTSDWPNLVQLAEQIKEELARVGIKVEIKMLPFTDLEASVIRPRNYEMLLFGEVYGYEPDPFAFWHSSQIKDPGLNITLYANKKVDRILEEARQTKDPDVRISRFKDFLRILRDDNPAIFLFSQLYFYILPRDLQGVTLERISLPSDRFNDANMWYRATKRVFQ
ncbi:MAG: hypothetical protein G01um101433_1098 [Parcubacteria group bacterium Gr01-1014_33]|nr:MAG: hypothetical protein G01um101433_1098 [Parcubacteria group bacterium Gr01-1014_33]